VTIVPVGSASAPTKSDYEVARVVPIGMDVALALVVREVRKVAIVVLNIVDRLTLLQLVLCRLRQSNRRSGGRTQEGEKSGSELHVVEMMVMMIEDERDVVVGVQWIREISEHIIYPSARTDAHGSSRCHSAWKRHRIQAQTSRRQPLPKQYTRVTSKP
jgi:hypothetical protein